MEQGASSSKMFREYWSLAWILRRATLRRQSSWCTSTCSSFARNMTDAAMG